MVFDKKIKKKTNYYISNFKNTKVIFLYTKEEKMIKLLSIIGDR